MRPKTRGPMDDVSALDPVAWQAGLEMFNGWNSPWCKLLDQAFSILRGLPDAAVPPAYADLEALKLALATGREYVWQPPAPA